MSSRTASSFFSSESPKTSSGRNDRYYLQIGSAGIDVRRQTTSKNGHHSLIKIDRSPESFSGKEASFEIRFDHRQRRLMLYIDNQLQGQASDPLDVAPESTLLSRPEPGSEQGPPSSLMAIDTKVLRTPPTSTASGT